MEISEEDFQKILKLELSQKPAVPVLGIYAKELMFYHRYSCGSMLLHSSQQWGNRTSLHKWLMVFYLAVKKTDIKLVGGWMELESTTLSEIAQTQKDKYCLLSLTCESQFLMFIYIYNLLYEITHQFHYRKYVNPPIINTSKVNITFILSQVTGEVGFAFGEVAYTLQLFLYFCPVNHNNIYLSG